MDGLLPWAFVAVTVQFFVLAYLSALTLAHFKLRERFNRLDAELRRDPPTTVVDDQVEDWRRSVM